MFAGPNGSGKSFLINEVKRKFNLGYLINADFVEWKLNQHRALDCSDFVPSTLDQKDLDEFLSTPEIRTRLQNDSFHSARIRNNVFITDDKITSYEAAIICEFFREALLKSDHTFSFETVMSHPSKPHFLRRANEKSFKTYLYYVCTPDPLINISRVRDRFLKGGHDVPEDKIITRYYRSLRLLTTAFKSVDRAFILDSTLSMDNVIVEKNENNVYIRTEIIPQWVDQFLLKELGLN